MTITSVGYGGGSITEDNWADIAPHLGSEYGVGGAADWKVTTVPASDRTVQVALGVGWGRGVTDTQSGTPATLALDIVSSGFRVDLIVAHRDWSGSGGTTTFAVVKGTVGNDDGTSALNARKKRAVDLTVDDQPIALVRVDAGQTVPTKIWDLRVWQANSGAIADPTDGLYVLQYLTAVGTEVIIGTDRWARVFDGSGNPTWRRTALLNPVNLLGAGTALAGTPAAGAGFFLQAGTQIATSDNSGYTRITFPVPFPNGLLIAHAWNGDDSAANDVTMAATTAVWGLGSRMDYVYRLWGPSGGGRAILTNYRHRANWLAIGF